MKTYTALEHIEAAMISISLAGQAGKQPWPSSYWPVVDQDSIASADALADVAYALVEAHGLRSGDSVSPIFMDYGDAVAYLAVCNLIAEASVLPSFITALTLERDPKVADL